MNRIVESISERILGGPIKRLYRLKSAYSIALELSSALDLEDASKTLTNRIASYMGVEIISIMFVDSEKRRLIIKIAKGLSEEIVKNSRVEFGKGVSGWVGKTGEPLLIKDITKDRRFVSRSGGRYYNNSLLSVPLKIRDSVIGVINVNNKTSKSIFRMYDLDLLRAIADMAVIAIENVRLRDANKKAESFNYELISNISHELKTPLTILREALAIMLNGAMGAINETQRKYLEIAHKNSGHLKCLIDEFLQSSAAAQGKLSIKRGLFNITDVARNVVDSLNVLAREKGVVLKGIIPDKRLEIWGDPEKLNQVISNLVDNAIKYNRPRGEVELYLYEEDAFVAISVRDTGMGIPPEEVDKIFNRFYRVRRNSEGISGTGLGLSIAKDIIEMHKGDIHVESDTDKGSRFTVTLPKTLRKESS